MKIVTYLITEGYGISDITGFLDGPSTKDLDELRHAFREAYGFPSSDGSETFQEWNAQSADAVARAGHALGSTDPIDREESLFVLWLKKYHGFTDHPHVTFHYA